jgi:hypothetical protein
MRSFLILFSDFPVRLVLYAILEAMALQAIVVTIINDGSQIFQEDGPIESVHFGLMIACSVVFLWNRRGNSAYPSLLLFCSLLALIAALRELDHYSEVMLFRGAYKYPGGAIGALALYHLGKDRQKLRKEISAFIKEPAFFFLAFGFFLAAILAQILGQAELWHALIETSSARTAKRTFEETVETVGYLTLFFGAIETRVSAAR